MELLIELFNDMGVPVAMLIYFIYDKLTTTKNMTQAIENNTIILTRLLERFSSSDLADKLSE